VNPVRTINETLDRFLGAVKGNDLEAMGRLWGTERGPAMDWMKPEERRQRLAVIQKYLSHSGYRVVDGPLTSPTNANIRTFRVELQRAGCTHVQPIDLVRQRSGGWLIFDVHLESSQSPNAPCAATGNH